MDMGSLEQKAPRTDGFWFPVTPFRPILPNSHVNLTDRQGNPDTTNQLGSQWFTPVFTPTTCADDSGKPMSTNGIEMDAKSPNEIIRENDSMCRGYYVHNGAFWFHPSFQSLLALADAAPIAPMGATMPWDRDFPCPPNPWNNMCMPDNNWGNSDAFSSCTTSQFAPLTPEKSIRTESRWVNVGMNGHSNEQENTNDNAGLAAKELDRGKEMQMRSSPLIDVNSFPKEDQCNDNGAIQNTELNKTPPQKPRKKKHRPKVITEGKPRTQKTTIPNHDSLKESPKTKRKYNALNETSQEKALNEYSNHKDNAYGESKGTSTGKRKYERRKPLNKAATAMPAENTKESSDPKNTGTAAFEGSPPDRSMSQKVQKKASTTTRPAEATMGFMDQKTPEAARKPCRRALNFNIEGQWVDESSRCKLMVNVDSSPRTQDDRKGAEEYSTMNLSCGVQVIVRNSQNGATCDINSIVDKIQKDYVSERQALDESIPAKTTACQDNWVTRIPESHTKGIYQSAPNLLQDNASLMMSKDGNQLSPMSPDDSNIIATLDDEGEARGLKGKDSVSFGQVDSHGTNITGIHYNDLVAYQNLVPFPWPYKKKRTEKGQSTSTSFSLAKDSIGLQVAFQEGSISADKSYNSSLNSLTNGHPGTTSEKGASFQPQQLPTSGSVFCNSERPTQKRSRNRWPRNSAPPTQFVPPSYQRGGALVDCGIQQLENFPSPATSRKALVAGTSATLTTKKRTKKRMSIVQSATHIGNEEKCQGELIICNQNQFSVNASGALEFMWKQMFSVDEIANQMKNLNINKESNERQGDEGSALVPYTIRNSKELVLYRDGTIVPHDGSFERIKKRRPRPKVELDEETNRVWKLLMENINNEGINGTDEDKAKWWEEERNVFRGRTNSFIARMHLVQGDRRFSPWKGSVVDSVVGVFLTQNVSDHLSSSAFMSLAARFPLKSNKPTFEVATSSETDEPIKCLLSPEISTECNKEISSESNCETSCMTLPITEIEEREVANSDESLGSNTSSFSSGTNVDACYELTLSRSTKNAEIAGPGRETMDMYPSQDSPESTISHPCKRKKSLSPNDPATNMTDGCEHNQPCHSFVELLLRASSKTKHDVYNQGNGDAVSTLNLNYPYHITEHVENTVQTQTLDNFDALKSSLGAYVTPYSDGLAHPSDVGVLKAHNLKMIFGKTTQVEASKNLGQNNIDYCNLAAESASQMTDTNRQVICHDGTQNCPIASAPSHNAVQGNGILGVWYERRLNMDAKTAGTSSSQAQKDELQPEILGALDIADETSGKQDKSTQNFTLSYLTGNNLLESKELKMNEAKRKAKSRRVGDEIQDNVDWDTLRKQAEACGGKRERSANTMDSLDWEAVRSANVEEIADAIKERGMNNILAGRIKDFLDRLVNEHGSIDLEWLRDIPPDKAKEYLLSIRGLGLKSVECVRLLTLHHLAFPVDTNVGRIAVRLGWVPLQPLPESLQLHLLELYPVLESIQKYLWPRLCKLDQRTLYELHYQMITFGKVFCTKSKPNCNACPMRGECRHFASAFASARLALPGPEQKSIVCATEKIIADQNTDAVVTERLLLTQPNASENLEANELSHANFQAKVGVSNSVPIVEEPSTPESQCTQIQENDIEDIFYEDPNEIPTIKLNIQEFTQNLQNYMQENMELQESDVSKALVALTAEAASIPMPKLKNISYLRTEHQVYELPDSHPLVQGLDRREPDDPCSYLLAIWTPGEMADSIEPPEKRCNSQQNGQLCDDITCFSCNCAREVNSQIVRGTLLIPCRTAMRGSFPLNGTYFQVNEVFADHESSLNPIHVPREWIWNLPRRTVYFGTSIPTIFKGLPTEGIQHCFWRGYVCVRGFDQKTRAPRPLMARLHFPASKLKARNNDDKQWERLFPGPSRTTSKNAYDK